MSQMPCYVPHIIRPCREKLRKRECVLRVQDPAAPEMRNSERASEIKLVVLASRRPDPVLYRVVNRW